MLLKRIYFWNKLFDLASIWTHLNSFSLNSIVQVKNVYTIFSFAGRDGTLKCWDTHQPILFERVKRKLDLYLVHGLLLLCPLSTTAVEIKHLLCCLILLQWASFEQCTKSIELQISGSHAFTLYHCYNSLNLCSDFLYFCTLVCPVNCVWISASMQLQKVTSSNVTQFIFSDRLVQLIFYHRCICCHSLSFDLFDCFLRVQISIYFLRTTTVFMCMRLAFVFVVRLSTFHLWRGDINQYFE